MKRVYPEKWIEIMKHCLTKYAEIPCTSCSSEGAALYLDELYDAGLLKEPPHPRIWAICEIHDSLWSKYPQPSKYCALVAANGSAPDQCKPTIVQEVLGDK